MSLIPKGYNQITSTGTARGLGFGLTGNAVPAGANSALIQAETQALRLRDDGTNPTASVGFVIPAGTALNYSGVLANVRVIAQTAGAIANVLFYKT